MPSRKAVVMDLVGLHARPAAAFVRAVNDSGFPVTITRDGGPETDARSLLQVMAADFHHGCEVRLDISDDVPLPAGSHTSAEQVLAELAALLETPGGVH